MDLKNQYLEAKYKLQGNGARDVRLLKEAFENIPANQSADTYGSGEVIDRFERKFSSLLGKESTVFMPSGVMAQQIALRINADETGCKNIAYHSLSHLEIHENDVIRVLHQLRPIILGDKNRLFTIDDLMAVDEKIGTLLVELPQREIGGYLPEYEDLEAIADYARSEGMSMHLDGARLFESLPYYQKSAKQVCKCFDSVYISFYKGIGAIAGAILAGEKAFIEKAKVWKRRLGGDLISLYPYIVPADFYYERRIGKMQEFYCNAKELAKHFNDVAYISTKPETPYTNMFHVHVEKSAEELQAIAGMVYDQTGVSLTNHIVKVDETTSKFEVSIGEEYSKIPEGSMQKVFSALKEPL